MPCQFIYYMYCEKKIIVKLQCTKNKHLLLEKTQATFCSIWICACVFFFLVCVSFVLTHILCCLFFHTVNVLNGGS